MSVQVINKNKVKSTSSGVITLFGDEKFQIKNVGSLFSKSELSYIEKILKNKKNTKESIILFNINEKSTVILISIKKNLKGSGVENLGAQFYNFIKKISSIRNNQKTIKTLGPSASIIAECEGLDAHAKSIQARLNGK